MTHLLTETAVATPGRVFLRAQRKKLETTRDALLAKAGVSAIRLAAESRGGAPPAEDTERAVADGEQELAVTLLNGSLATFREVVAAIEKFDTGTYGICEQCGGLIAQARLKARPEARNCVSCQAGEEVARRR